MRAAVSLANLLVCATAVASCVTASSPPPPAASPGAPNQPESDRPAGPAGDDDFRSRPPEPEPAADYVAPVPQTSVLPNGLRLWVIERHTSEMVAATLVVRGGTAAFPDRPPALSSILNESIMNGTTTHSEREIFDLMSAQFLMMETSSSDSSFRVNISAARDSYEGALAVMRDVALRPAISIERVETVRQRQLARAPAASDDPILIGHRNLFGALYGPGHPYTRFLDSTGPTLATLKRDDVVRTWKEIMDPARATLIIAGAVDATTVAARVQALFGDWKRDPTTEAPHPVPAPSPTQPRLIVVDRPGAPQATVMYGTTTAAVQAPEHVTDLVVHQLLGGRRSSPTVGKIRDQLGATWTSNSLQHIHRAGGIHWWQGSVAPDRTAAVLSTLEARVRELHERGPAAEELAAVKLWLARPLPRALETASGVARAFAGEVVDDLPPDNLATLSARLEKVSPGAVKAQAPDPAAMKAVVVGDLRVLRASLLTLGWGPIEEHDRDGKLVRVLSP